MTSVFDDVLDKEMTAALVEPVLKLALKTDNKIILSKLEEYFFGHFLSEENASDKGLDARLIGQIVWETASTAETRMKSNRVMLYGVVKRISAQFGEKGDEDAKWDKQEVKQECDKQEEAKEEEEKENKSEQNSNSNGSDGEKKSVSWSTKQKVRIFNKKLPVGRSPSPVLQKEAPAKGLLKPFEKPLIREISEQQPPKKKRRKMGFTVLSNNEATEEVINRRPKASDFM